MNDEFYDQYYQKDGTYVIPIEIFNQLIGEVEDKDNLIKYLEDKVKESKYNNDFFRWSAYSDILERVKNNNYD